MLCDPHAVKVAAIVGICVVVIAAVVIGLLQAGGDETPAAGGVPTQEEALAGLQGSPPRLAAIHRAEVIRELPAPTTGRVTRADAGRIGQAALQLGAGRSKASDGVDFAVGLDQLVKVGQTVHAGQPLCRIHARHQADFDMAEALVFQAIHIDSHPGLASVT